MYDAPPVAEGLNELGGGDRGSIRCQCAGNPKYSNIVSEDLDNLFTVILGQLDDAQPLRVSVNHRKVVVRRDMEEVCADTLEVACVEVLQHILSQGLRYDWTVVEHHNRSNIGEGMSVLEEILNLLIPVSTLIRHSSLDCVVEKFVLVTA